MNIQKHLISSEELHNPVSWFFKAQSFRSTVLFILEEHKQRVVDGAKIDEILLIDDAIQTTPYLACIGLELYMKGYLVLMDPNKNVRKYGHKIWDLRKECYEIANSVEFEDLDLKYLTDQFGPHILENGGVRYPDNRDLGIPIDSIIQSLDLMHDLLRIGIKTKKAIQKFQT